MTINNFQFNIIIKLISLNFILFKVTVTLNRQRKNLKNNYVKMAIKVKVVIIKNEQKKIMI